MMFKCKAGCQSECCGNVPVPKTIIKQHRNKIHRKYKKEVLDNGDIYPITSDGKCIFLDHRFQCGIYKERPFVCRIYGTIKELQCPYIDINGNQRSDDQIVEAKRNISRYVDENYYLFSKKYLSGQTFIPPFI